MLALPLAALRLGRALCAGWALLLPVAASAGTDCDGSAEPYVFDERKRSLGPAHHPNGRPLPATAAFNAPDRCVAGIWFFDLNGNAQSDAGEPRLFGPQRVIDCGSCHGDSPEPKAAQSASVFLRLDVSSLCLVCHRM